MFAGSPLSSKTSSSTSPHPPLSPSAQSDTEGPEEGKPTSVASSFSLPCWATQALCDLARCETDLRRLREQQVSEAQTTSRGVERALLGAQREEHRLLERVEQDHRDVQRKLEQVQRENAAAIRVGQTLVDQRLRKVIKLRELIKKTSGEANRDGEGDQRRDQLLKGIADLLQPWEVMLALKRVSFKPSAQPNAVTFGEIKVQDHNVHFPIGGCGQQRQMCSLHSTEAYSGNHVDQGGEGENIPDEASPGQGQVLCPGSKPKYSTTSSGNLRVVRKLRLSARSDEESGEDMKLQSPRLHHWPPKQVPCERDSSQEEECESPTSECKGDELFVAVPSLRQRESEEDVFGHLQNGAITQFPSQRARRQRELSPSLEQGHHEQCSWSMHQYNNQNQRTNTGRNRSSRETSQFGTQACPQSPREPLTKQGNQLLRGRSFSQLSASSDDQAHNRPPSPADSVDSGYTFIVSSPRDYTNSLCPTARLSRSTVDLTNCSRPLSGTRADQSSLWTVTKSRLSSLSSRSFQRKNVSQTTSCPSHGMLCPKNTHQYNSHSCRVSRSLSMSVINSSSQKRLNHQETGRKNTLNENRLWGERSEPALLELEEDAEQARLVRQFGKQGSGRADLTLPSGVHATPQGQLFLVDCGNARVQVTDSHGNVLQQVSSTGNDLGGSLRRCRNYFDVAVNAKGLIALSCAAERALLIFSRHGRLLQTFGGGPYIAGVPRDELEAPRGVTVTQRDEFLVADIRKGTLTALKLEPKTGSRLERTVVTGFHRPYLVAACLHSGLVAVSERGSETNQEPCVKILGPGWDTLRILGVCSSLGPVLSCPWGLCIDKDGDVLVADWAEKHRVVLYPAEGTGRVMVSDGLSSPRGLALLPNDLLVVSDSMHHCIKIYQYK